MRRRQAGYSDDSGDSSTEETLSGVFGGRKAISTLKMGGAKTSGGAT